MKTDLEKLISGHKPVLVEFYTEKCKPCMAVAPILEELKEKVGTRAKVIKIDLEKNPQYAEKYNIYNVPHLIIFVDDKVYWRHAGVMTTADLLAYLEPAIHSSSIGEHTEPPQVEEE
jgi:thioredoxin 1